MLRTLFDALEKSMGHSLDGPASAMWALGLALVALQALAVVVRIALALSFSRAGLERAWVVRCGACGTSTRVGEPCSKCGAALSVPALGRLFARQRPPGPRRLRAGVAWSAVGAVLYGLASLRLVAWLAPSGVVERLFGGAALFAWAGLGHFLSRALGPRGRGPVARTRELLFSFAALTLLGCAVFLEETVRPVPERVLGHVTVLDASTVEIDGAKLSLAGPELGLEVQLVEHPGLGIGRVLPLAWLGAAKAPIELGTADAWLRDAAWKNAQTVMAAGGQVKRRTETFPLAPGARYEVVLREHDVLLKPAR